MVRFAAFAVSALLLVGAVAGCSGDEAEPSTLPPLPSAGASGNETTSASPAPAQTAVGAGGEPSAPPEASGLQVPTSEGATAFALYFFDQVNAAYSQRRPDLVTHLSADECGSCAAVAKDVARLADEGHSVGGRRYVLSSAEAAPADAQGRVVVDFRFEADPYVERDAQARTVREFPSESAQDAQIAMAQVDGRWLVRAIRLVKA